MLSIAIRTAPRKVSYLERTISSIRAIYPHNELIAFAEPDSLVPNRSDIIINQNKKRLGVYGNFLRALTSLAATSSEWLMVCEDDLELLPCFAQQFTHARTHLQNIAFLQPYCAMPRGNADIIGWYKVKDRPLFGALCLIFHRSTVQQLLSLYKKESPPDRGADSCIGILTAKSGLSVWQHTPSLVRHIGDESTIIDVSSLPKRLQQNREAYFGGYSNDSQP